MNEKVTRVVGHKTCPKCNGQAEAIPIGDAYFRTPKGKIMADFDDKGNLSAGGYKPAKIVYACNQCKHMINDDVLPSCMTIAKALKEAEDAIAPIGVM